MADSITFHAPAYAGFWRRTAASGFDYFFFIGWVLPFTVMVVGGRVLIVLAAFLPVVVLYFVALESSPVQATVGKLLMGIYVTDSAGGRLSFVRSLVRNVLKNLLMWPMFCSLAFLTAAFTERKRAPPDMVAGALVLDRGSAGFLRGLLVSISSIFVMALGLFVFSGSMVALKKNADELVQSWERKAASQESSALPSAPAQTQAPQANPSQPTAPAASAAPAAPPAAVVRPSPAPASATPAARAAPAAVPKRKAADGCVYKPVMTDEDMAKCR
jgi:uncharacterized RDD family membrane protein YckC